MTIPTGRALAYRALTPAPKKTAMLRMIRGEARSVDRMARPAVVSTMIFLMTEPMLDGCSYGLGPTAITMPTTVNKMKYVR